MNEEAKKKILRKIPYGLYVIGVKGENACHAFTGSWLSQCSMRPPKVMLGVRHGTHSLDLLKEGKAFSVNFLGKSDTKVFEQFFKATPSNGDRFGEIAFSLKKTGTPILAKSIHYLECVVSDILEVGDHSVVVGEVVEAEVVRDEPPLVMSDTPWHYGG
ncbi:MAG: flavin reductase family protein [Candidatus Omnitrophica bacterium]|nr:flavin reductase family protein [Candidatus Omnitrophota bacterium]